MPCLDLPNLLGNKPLKSKGLLQMQSPIALSNGLTDNRLRDLGCSKRLDHFTRA